MGTTEGFVQITEVPQLLWESASMFSLLVKSARSSWTLLLTCILGKKRLKQKDNAMEQILKTIVNDFLFQAILERRQIEI